MTDRPVIKTVMEEDSTALQGSSKISPEQLGFTHKLMAPKLVCVGCGRILKPEEEDRTWGKCSHCQEPVCFECSLRRTIFSTNKESIYFGNSYVEEIRLCKECWGGSP